MKLMSKRFGMFVHWGIYSLTGWQEQYRMRLGVSRGEYAKLAKSFNPVEYDPEDWVRLARDAGMEYICFTTKHHDGFCMWDTSETDFKITNTPYGKDVLKALADACAKYGIALSLYYSIPDWNRPDAYNPLSSHQCPPEDGDVPDSEAYRGYVRRQLKELLTGYGGIYSLFWDIPPKIDDPSMNEYARSLMPGILINDRGWSPGDYSTPERTVPDGEAFERYTEACQSVGAQSWGYRRDEDYFTPEFLTQSIDKIMLMGGSYLLNVGPDSLGRICGRPREIVTRCGEWYKSVREAFEADENGPAAPCRGFSSGAFSAASRNGVYYLHLIKPPVSSGISLAPCDIPPKKVSLLGSDAEIKWSIETCPEDFTGSFGVSRAPSLRLHGIDARDYGMPVVIKLEF